MSALFVVFLLFSAPAHALSAEAKEFIDINRQLEPVQCEKRRLRREIALAEIEQRSTKELRERFSKLNRDPQTAKLERRLAELSPRVQHSSDPEDLGAISFQQRQAFYRCE